MSVLRRFLDARIGPLSGRAWGLILNLAGNAVALWGVASVMSGGRGWLWVAVGGLATAVCVAVLALPSEDGS